MLKRKGLVVACIIAIALMGCEKKESAEKAAAPQTAQTEQATQAAPSEASFSTAVPPSIAGKTIVKGGKANAELLNKANFPNVADIKSGDPIEIEGWAFSDSTKSVPDTVVVELVGSNGSKYYAPAIRSSRKRNDVVKYFKEPAYEKSGYVLKADTKAVAPGEYEVIVIQVIDGKPCRAYPGKKLKVS